MGVSGWIHTLGASLSVQEHLSGSQSQSTCFGKEENILALLAINQDYIYMKRHCPPVRVIN